MRNRGKIGDYLARRENGRRGAAKKGDQEKQHGAQASKRGGKRGDKMRIGSEKSQPGRPD